MKVWAGCEACWDSHTYTGRWVDSELLSTLDPEEEHQLRAYDVVVTGAHLAPMRGYRLEDFGVPFEQSPEQVLVQAQVMDLLTEHNLEYAAWLMAAWYLDKEIWELTPELFKALYAGQWAGRPTRALKKRYRLTRAGEDYYYMWRA